MKAWIPVLQCSYVKLLGEAQVMKTPPDKLIYLLIHNCSWEVAETLDVGPSGREKLMVFIFKRRICPQPLPSHPLFPGYHDMGSFYLLYATQHAFCITISLKAIKPANHRLKSLIQELK